MENNRPSRGEARDNDNWAKLDDNTSAAKALRMQLPMRYSPCSMKKANSSFLGLDETPILC
jgi:hypothetical protein